MLQDLLRQLGELLLGSVPTMIIFLILVVAYRFLLHGPLKRVLAERHDRTLGAVDKAHASVAAADSRSQEYEARLRAARAEIFSAREKRVQEWNALRDKAVEAARLAARDRIAAARRGIEQESATARQQIESSTDQLAAQILQAVLPARAEGVR